MNFLLNIQQLIQDQSKIIIKFVKKTINILHITFLPNPKPEMQPQSPLIKLPQLLSDHLLHQQPSVQTLYYFTIFTTSTASYIMHISLNPPSHLPLTLFPTSPNFSVTKQSLTRQNKHNIVKKYEICSCDQLNQVTKQYLIINFVITGYMGIQTQIIGWNFYINNNPINQHPKTKQQLSQQTTYNICNFSTALGITKKNALSIWNTFVNRSNKFVKNKEKDPNKCVTSTLHLFLQYQFNVIQRVKYQEMFEYQIEEKEKYYHNYPIIFPITEQQISSTQIINFLTEQLLSSNQNHQIHSSLPLALSSPNAHPKKIWNPHLFAKCQKKQKYQLITVQGFYEYYHYNDQNFCDRGWGCAYRSLQTILSWLHIQGHTDHLPQIPSLLSIQQKLDQIDYKSKLKGTKTWIGTTQISRIVSSLTSPQINCKILHLKLGKNIQDFYEEFKQYLLHTGCPIIYCGGEYAYMIVGMHYNWKLGECQFLILDPHYEGEDDYAKIIQQNALAWKKPQEIFKDNVFYNFCLPLVK